MHRLADRERALTPGQCSLGEVRMNRKVVHGFFVLAVAITSCDSRDCDCDTAAANVRLVRRSVELGYNNRDPEFFDSAYHADAVVWNNGVLLDDGPILDGFRADLAAYDQMFSAWRIEVNDIFGTADRVAVRWTFHGRLRDSGRDVTQTGNWIGRFDGGKIVEVWEATQEPDAPPPQARARRNGRSPGETTPSARAGRQRLGRLTYGMHGASERAATRSRIRPARL